MDKDKTDTVQQDAPNVTQEMPPADADTGKLIFGKYKTMEEAEKAYKEAERAIQTKAQEASLARKQAEELSEKIRLNQTLENLAEHLKPKEPQVDYTKFVEDLAETARNDPGEALKKAAFYSNALANEVEKKTISVVEQKFNELQSRLFNLQENVEKDGFYHENQELIEGLRKDGMSLAKAKDWARKMVASKPVEMPGRGEIPVSMSGARITERTNMSSYLSVDDKQAMKSRGLSDEAIAMIELEAKQQMVGKGN